MRKKTPLLWLSRSECAALRGLAILCIVLHNFCHWTGCAVQENEYLFKASNAGRMWDSLMEPDPYLPVRLFSFFGHYGVPVFLFLSGFGLVMKYGTLERLPVWRFLRYHYLKLFVMMSAGFAVFVFFDAIVRRPFAYHAENVLAQLAMVINLLPDPSSVIWPGPYWFFGLMLQFYIIYRLLLHRRHWGVAVGLVAVCWAAQAVSAPTGSVLAWLRYNSVGGMLPFCAGVLAARASQDGRLDRLAGWSRRRWALLLACGLAAVPMSMSYQLWLWIPLVAVVFSIGIVKTFSGKALTWLEWLGHVSAAMFCIHPVLRKVFIPMSQRGAVYDGICLYLLTTVAAAWFFKQLLDRIAIPKPDSHLQSPDHPSHP